MTEHSDDFVQPCIWPHDRPHIWTSSGPIGDEQECDLGCGVRYGDFKATGLEVDADPIPWHRMLKYQVRTYLYLLRRRWWNLTPWWTHQGDCRCLYRGRRQQVYCLTHCIESLGFSREELEAARVSGSEGQAS